MPTKVPRGTSLDESTRRWMVAGLILMTLFVVAFPVFRVYEPARRAEARVRQHQYLAELGAELYTTMCESCHGVAGRGAVAPAVGSIDFLQEAADVQIAAIIVHGVPGTEMSPYGLDLGGPLTSTQVTSLTAYLRSLEETRFESANWRTPLADSNLSGRDLFNMACSRCHGSGLGGIDGVAPALGPGSEASEDNDSRLASQIAEGGDEMPRFGGVLTPDQVGMVVAYLRTVQSGG